MDEVLDQQAEKLAITRRIAGDIKDIWALQPRFDRRNGKGPYRLIEQPRYRAAWDFLRLRAEAGELDAELPEWWRHFAHANPVDRESLLQSQGGAAPKKRRRRRRKAASNQPAGDEDSPASQ